MRRPDGKRLWHAGRLALCLALSACTGLPAIVVAAPGVHPKTYPGDARPLADVGVAVGARRAYQLATRPSAIERPDYFRETVLITAIDGQRWSLPEAHLLPGYHEIRVRYWWAEDHDLMRWQDWVVIGVISPFLPLVWPAMIVAGLSQLTLHGWDRTWKEYTSYRTLRLSVDPGSTYVLQMQRIPLRYYVSRYPTVALPEPIPWNPDFEEAWPCTPEGDADSEFLLCGPVL